MLCLASVHEQTRSAKFIASPIVRNLCVNLNLGQKGALPWWDPCGLSYPDWLFPLFRILMEKGTSLQASAS